MKEKNGLKKTLAVFLVVVLLLTTAPLAGFVGMEFPRLNFGGWLDSVGEWFGGRASAETWEKLTYEVSDGKATITDCSTSISGELVIPETLGGYPVTSIGDWAFSDCTGLTSITIPDSVTSIGDFAFSWCTGLTKINWNAENVSDFRFDDYVFSNAGTAGDGIDVVFGDSVKNIPEYAFFTEYDDNQPNIKSVTIGNSVTSIGGSAFEDCTGLTSVTIGNSVTSIGYSAFRNCTGLTSITIPDSITSIGGSAFDNTAWYNAQPFGDVYAGKVYYMYKGTMPENTSVEIKDGTKGIAGGAFGGCNGLVDINIPDSVTNIGNGAFSDCTSLTSITIGDSVTSIGGWAFSSCTGLTSITIPDSVTSIGWRAFSGCTGLTSITIPDGVTSIGDSTFSGCTGLTSVTIGNSVTSIGESAFYGCTDLTKINWNAENVSDFSYDNYVFSNAGTAGDGIDVVFGDSVKSIPAYLFYNSSSSSYTTPNIKSVTISDSVTSIGSYAFDNTAWYNAQPFGDVYAGKVYYKYKGTMPKNTNIDIKDGTKGIADIAFSGCNGLVDINIPDSVTNIGDGAFSDCTGLTSVTIPDSVTSIGGSAFEDCTRLTSVTIGNSVTSISDYAFESCSYLTSITIPDSVTSIGYRAFYYCTGLTSVTIGNSVTSIGSSAFSDCWDLKSITIGDSVTSIGSSAFEDCTSLTSITIPDSVTSIGGSAFFGCTGLTSATIGNGVETILTGTFEDCPGLTTIKIKKGVKVIEGNAFYGIKSIPDVFFEGSEEEWKAISIDQSNDMILRANMYYNSNLTHEHSYTETVKEATCTEDGLKTFTCECGKSYTEKIKSPGHRFEIVVVEPTCTSIGYVTNTCKNCGESYFVKTLPATGHDESEWIIDKNADCKNAGSKHKECTVCKELIKTEIIPMTSHSFISSIVEPTCISLGYETRTCENCGECQFVRVLPATGHKEVLVSGKPATCTETGLTEGKKCSFCGEILVKQEEILALGHDLAIDVEAKDPTCTESGTTEVKHCSRCDYKVETQEIPALGHTDENNDGKCDRCGEKIDDPVTPPQSDPPANCSCACHKGGIANFFFKIGLFFQKIFKKNKVCRCGVYHY